MSVLGMHFAYADGETSYRLEEIIVTAQKREESLQDVPISILLTTGEEILNDQLRSLQEVTARQPNVTVTKAGSADRMYMRGVGSGNNGGFEMSVATVIDEIYHGRSKISRGALVDIERIEVLRGPQITYFGNNTNGGAFNIITRDPGPDWEAYAMTSFEFEQNEIVIEGAGGGPITDTLGFRVAGRFLNTDGYIENRGTGESDPNGQDRYVRATIVWAPSDDLKVNFKAAISDEIRDGGWATQMFGCPPGPEFPAGPGLFCATILADPNAESDLDFRRESTEGEILDLKTQAYTLSIDYHFNDIEFNSVTGYTKYKFESNGDLDTTAQNLEGFEQFEHGDQFSQEIRLSSTGDQVGLKVDAFGWMIGAYYQDNDLLYPSDVALQFVTPFTAFPFFAPLAPFTPIGVRGGLEQETETVSAFGSLTWSITERLTASLGLRWTDVEKDATSFADIISVTGTFGQGIPLPRNLLPEGTALTGVTPHTTPVSLSESDLMPSIALQYDLTDDLVAYAKYNEGFKSGGFEQLELTGDLDRIAFGSETVKAYEIGLKGFWRDKGIRLNLAAFRSENKNLQVSQSFIRQGVFFFAIGNAGELISQGIEADLTWAINDQWSVYATAAWLDAEIKGFPNAGCTALQIINTPPPCVQDLSGTRPEFAPEYSGAVTVSFIQPFSNKEFFASAIVSFSDEYLVNSDNDPIAVQDAHSKQDVRVGIRRADERWEVAFIGKNLSDEITTGYINDIPATPGSNWALVDPPRTFTLQAKLKW